MLLQNITATRKCADCVIFTDESTRTCIMANTTNGNAEAKQFFIGVEGTRVEVATITNQAIIKKWTNYFYSTEWKMYVFLKIWKGHLQVRSGVSSQSDFSTTWWCLFITHSTQIKKQTKQQQQQQEKRPTGCRTGGSVDKNVLILATPN